MTSYRRQTQRFASSDFSDLPLPETMYLIRCSQLFISLTTLYGSKNPVKSAIQVGLEEFVACNYRTSRGVV